MDNRKHVPTAHIKINFKEVKIMRDIRIEKLASNLLSHSVKLQKDEKVLIEIIGMDAIPLGKGLIRQAEKRI